MTSITIAGNIKEVKSIIESLIKQHGNNASILEVTKVFKKDNLVLV